MTGEVDLGSMPHCDPSVLHRPGSCEYCDRHPDWQALRKVWGIAFTGETPVAHHPGWREVACPSDQRRGVGQAHVWGGNRPTSGQVDVPQSPESRIFYGDLDRGKDA